MPIPQQSIDQLVRAVQPLVFETGVEEAPYSSTRGTVFLVRYEGCPYVIAARHALQPGNIVATCVFASETSNRLLPLKDVFFVPQDMNDEDFVDLAVIAIDKKRVVHPEVAQARVIDVTLACSEWKGYVSESQFFIIGYPEEPSTFNYEDQEFVTNREVLYGSYDGPSELSYLHKLRIADTRSLKTFSGLSGAPVFAWVERKEQRPIPVLCGMVLRGTPESGLIHFLDRDILLDALKVKRRLEQQADQDGSHPDQLGTPTRRYFTSP
jgi:hypothetical protein